LVDEDVTMTKKTRRRRRRKRRKKKRNGGGCQPPSEWEVEEHANPKFDFRHPIETRVLR